MRGLLISLKEGFIVGGILLGYLGSYVIVGEEGGWRTLLSSSSLVAAALAVGMTALPDSPRWLAQGGSEEEGPERAPARPRALGRGRRVDQEVRAMVASAGAARPAAHRGALSEAEPKPLYIGLSVVLFQQITGQPGCCITPSRCSKPPGTIPTKAPA